MLPPGFPGLQPLKVRNPGEQVWQPVLRTARSQPLGHKGPLWNVSRWQGGGDVTQGPQLLPTSVPWTATCTCASSSSRPMCSTCPSFSSLLDCGMQTPGSSPQAGSLVSIYIPRLHSAPGFTLALVSYSFSAPLEATFSGPFVLAFSPEVTEFMSTACQPSSLPIRVYAPSGPIILWGLS